MQSAPRTIQTLQVRGDSLRPFDLVVVGQFEWQVYRAPDRDGIAFLRDPAEQAFAQYKPRIRRLFTPDQLYEVRRSVPVPRTLAALPPVEAPAPAAFRSRPAEEIRRGDLLVWENVEYRVLSRAKLRGSLLLSFTAEPVAGGSARFLNFYPRNWVSVLRMPESISSRRS